MCTKCSAICVALLWWSATGDFLSTDVCWLLKSLEQLHADVSSMKQALRQQVDVSLDHHTVTADINHRVHDLENSADAERNCGQGVKISAREGDGQSGTGMAVEYGKPLPVESAAE